MDQLSLVEELGCDQMQGDLLGRPTPNTKLHLDKEYCRPLDQPCRIYSRGPKMATANGVSGLYDPT